MFSMKEKHAQADFSSTLYFCILFSMLTDNSSAYNMNITMNIQTDVHQLVHICSKITKNRFLLKQVCVHI